jgi:hypothetical protein
MAQASNILQFPSPKVSKTARSSPKGLRVPRTGDDRVFSYILQHSIAVAEGRTSDAERFLRCILLGGAQTRKGLIAMFKYLSGLTHIDFAAGEPLRHCCEGQSPVHQFFSSLASQLRGMKSEFPAERRSRARPD